MILSIQIIAVAYIMIGIYFLWQFYLPLSEAIDNPWELALEMLKILFLWPIEVKNGGDDL